VKVETYGNLVCEVLDPLVRTFTVAANGTRKLPATAYRAPDCAGRAKISVRVASTAGHDLARGTATFTITAPSS